MFDNELNSLDKNDYAKGSFLEKWPSWLRWILFIPAAIFVPILVSIIQTLSTTLYTGIEPDSFLMTLGKDFITGGGFVFIGAFVAPKGQFLVSLLLLVVLSIISVVSFLSNLITYTYQPLIMLIHCLVALGAGIYVVHYFYKETK
jgi:hypothetical protein